MKRWKLIFFSLLLSIPLLSFGGEKILFKDSFEKEGVWKGGGKRTSEFAHTGKYSWKLSSPSPVVYKGKKVDWVKQEIRSIPFSVKEGMVLSVSVWINIPEKLQDTSRGGVLNLLAHYKSTDKWKEVYLKEGSIFTGGWKKISAIYTVPKGVDKLKVRLGICGKGEVYFDDILLTKKIDKPEVKIKFMPPIMRNSIFETFPPEVIKAKIEILGRKPSQVSIRAKLTELKTEKVLFNQEVFLNSVNEFSLPAPKFSPRNDLLLEVTIWDRKDGKKVFYEKRIIKQLPADTTSQCLIDGNGNVIVNGKPFFPVGMYAIPKEDLKLAKEFGFNTVGLYETPSLLYIKEAEKYGLKVIFNLFEMLKDSEINQIRESPAFLGYYIFEEKPPTIADHFEEIRRRINQVDPYHLVIGCHYWFFKQYKNASEVIMIDHYPFGQPSYGGLARTIEKLRLAREIKGKEGSIWLVPQAFPWSVYGRKTFEEAPYPSFDELRAQTWLGIVEGAKGIIYYTYRLLYAGGGGIYTRLAYPIFWESLGYVVKELNHLKDIVWMKEYEGKINLSESKIKFLAKTDGKDLYIIAVNPEDQEFKVDFQIENTEINKMYVLSEKRILNCEKGKFRDIFLPKETHIYSTRARRTLESSISEIRERISKKEEKQKLIRERNLALRDNGATLTSSWGGFPGAERSYHGAWNLMHDGFYGTFWLIGRDDRNNLKNFLKERNIPFESIFTGNRWIGIKFARPSLVRKVIVVTANLDYQVFLTHGENLIHMSRSKIESVNVHPTLKAEKAYFLTHGIQADGLRLLLSPRSKPEEVIFEIQAF